MVDDHAKTQNDFKEHSVQSVWDETMMRVLNRNVMSSYDVGFPFIDHVVQGFYRRGLYIIGARYGCGIHAFILNIIVGCMLRHRALSAPSQHEDHFSQHDDTRTQDISDDTFNDEAASSNPWAILLISSTANRIDCMRSILSIMTDVPHTNMCQGLINETQFEQLAACEQKIASWPVTMIDDGDLTPDDIINCITSWSDRHRASNQLLVLIDSTWDWSPEYSPVSTDCFRDQRQSGIEYMCRLKSCCSSGATIIATSLVKGYEYVKGRVFEPHILDIIGLAAFRRYADAILILYRIGKPDRELQRVPIRLRSIDNAYGPLDSMTAWYDYSVNQFIPMGNSDDEVDNA